MSSGVFDIFYFFLHKLSIYFFLTSPYSIHIWFPCWFCTRLSWRLPFKNHPAERPAGSPFQRSWQSVVSHRLMGWSLGKLKDTKPTALWILTKTSLWRLVLASPLWCTLEAIWQCLLPYSRNAKKRHLQKPYEPHKTSSVEKARPQSTRRTLGNKCQHCQHELSTFTLSIRTKK